MRPSCGDSVTAGTSAFLAGTSAFPVAVVMRQLEAFRRDDFDTAYSFASATIHEIFDRARFESMVRGGYPEIARSANAAVVDREAGPNGSVYLRLEISGVNLRGVEAAAGFAGGRRACGGVGAISGPPPR